MLPERRGWVNMINGEKNYCNRKGSSSDICHKNGGVKMRMIQQDQGGRTKKNYPPQVKQQLSPIKYIIIFLKLFFFQKLDTVNYMNQSLRASFYKEIDLHFLLL